jgi:hypothetical protein
MNLAPGTKLGRYEIRSKIGEGGMGEVLSGCQWKDADADLRILQETKKEYENL